MTRTPLNQLRQRDPSAGAYLRNHGVVFKENTGVTDIDFADGADITAKTLYKRKAAIRRRASGEPEYVISTHRRN